VVGTDDLGLHAPPRPRPRFSFIHKTSTDALSTVFLRHDESSDSASVARRMEHRDEMDADDTDNAAGNLRDENTFRGQCRETSKPLADVLGFTRIAELAHQVSNVRIIRLPGKSDYHIVRHFRGHNVASEARPIGRRLHSPCVRPAWARTNGVTSPLYVNLSMR